jgi:hypothetical protein
MVTFETAQRELQSGKCRCGETKTAGDAFCRGCWLNLPGEYRGILTHFCRNTRAFRYMSKQRKRLIYWRCLVQLGLTVKRAEQDQARHQDQGNQEDSCCSYV